MSNAGSPMARPRRLRSIDHDGALIASPHAAPHGSPRRGSSMRSLKRGPASRRVSDVALRSPDPSPFTAAARRKSSEASAISDDHEGIAEQLVRLANKMGGELSVDVLSDVIWILRYVKGAMPKQRARELRVKRELRVWERQRMFHEDGVAEKVGLHRRRGRGVSVKGDRALREEAAKEEWRNELLGATITHLEHHVVHECEPTDLSSAKYWQIVARHGETRHRELRYRAFSSAVTAALVVAASMQCVVGDAVLKSTIRRCTSPTAVVAAVALLAASSRHFKPRVTLDFCTSPDPFIPFGAVEVLHFTDGLAGHRVSLLPALAGGSPARGLQCCSCDVLHDVSTTATLDLPKLTLTLAPPGLKLNLPWDNLRPLLLALRALLDRQGARHNFNEEIPSENAEELELHLRAQVGLFFVPGDPLGTVTKYEEEYASRQKKRSSWVSAERHAARRTTPSNDAIETPVLSPTAAPAHAKDDEPRTESPTPASEHLPDTRRKNPQPAGPLSVGAAPLASGKVAGLRAGKKAAKSMFDSLILATAVTRDAMLVKEVWAATIEGLREVCGAVRRSIQAQSTAPLQGPFFPSVHALLARLSVPGHEVETLKKTTADFCDLFASLACKVEYPSLLSPQAQLFGSAETSTPLQGPDGICFGGGRTTASKFGAFSLGSSASAQGSESGSPKSNKRGLGEKTRTGKEWEEREKELADLRDRIEELKAQAKARDSMVEAAAKERGRMERQMRSVAALLKADKKAVLERESLRQANKEVEEMAEAVATMRLEVVEYLLSISDPTPIQRSLATIAWMLTEYRKFLPTAILEERDADPLDDDDPTTTSQSRPPPSGSIAMVFTDIQGSTALWEAAPEGMKLGLSAHNAVMREHIKKFYGYEVKTIGDSFMVAFDSAEAACGFALEVQVALTKQNWHDSLLLCGDCARQEVEGVAVWNGMRIRVGIHYGKADIQTNPITGRADYFGPTVNKAARVEAAATGGLVAVTDQVLEALTPAQLERLRHPILIPYGAVQLKGVSGRTNISGLLPVTLEGRKLEVDPRNRKKSRAPEGRVALVFCDIQGAGKLWDAAPTAMAVASNTYNTVLHALVAENHGYLVKAAGDQFSIAFQNTFEACRFALNVQTSLLEQTWPTELAEHSLAACVKKEDVLLWNGPRARIGVHSGLVETESNALTGRTDYFGPTVNKAARVEAASCGGLVLVTGDVMEELGEEKKRSLGELHVVDYGCIELKGIPEGATVTGLFPESLKERQKTCSVQRARQDDESGGFAKQGSVSFSLDNRRCTMRTNLRAVKATIAFIELNLPLRRVQETLSILGSLLAAVEFSAERTEGTIAVAFGNMIIVTWNAGKRCKSHSTQAIRFANLLHHRLRGTSMKAHIGVATGELFNGVVAGERRRFTTAIGGSIEVARQLAKQCRKGGNFCLISDIAVPVFVAPLSGRQDFSTGDSVEVRDADDGDWKSGTVADVNRLIGCSVVLNGYTTASIFAQTRLAGAAEPEQYEPVTPRRRKQRFPSVIAFQHEKLLDDAPQGSGPNTPQPSPALSFASSPGPSPRGVRSRDREAKPGELRRKTSVRSGTNVQSLRRGQSVVEFVDGTLEAGRRAPREALQQQQLQLQQAQRRGSPDGELHVRRMSLIQGGGLHESEGGSSPPEQDLMRGADVESAWSNTEGDPVAATPEQKHTRRTLCSPDIGPIRGLPARSSSILRTSTQYDKDDEEDKAASARRADQLPPPPTVPTVATVPTVTFVGEQPVLPEQQAALPVTVGRAGEPSVGCPPHARVLLPAGAVPPAPASPPSPPINSPISPDRLSLGGAHKRTGALAPISLSSATSPVASVNSEQTPSTFSDSQKTVLAISQLQVKPLPLRHEPDYVGISPDAVEWVGWPNRSSAKVTSPKSQALDRTSLQDRLQKSVQRCPVLSDLGRQKGLNPTSGPLDSKAYFKVNQQPQAQPSPLHQRSTGSAPFAASGRRNSNGTRLRAEGPVNSSRPQKSSK
ncbi:hypothetical protein DIPPA_13515 [Diplonema papillatum]|nr:hypothetical protein DIPPA_13515 [Diplonema papillatum]